MWARIENARVAEFTQSDPTGRYTSQLQWLAVPVALRLWVNFDYIVTTDGLAPPSLDYIKQQLLGAIADRRWREETKGALVDDVRYHTDQQSQAKLTSALLMGQLLEPVNGGGSFQLTWKTMGGWKQLDLAALTTVALSCGQHVQTCFAREAAIAGLITDAADWQSAIQAYATNINTGWPA